MDDLFNKYEMLVAERRNFRKINDLEQWQHEFNNQIKQFEPLLKVLQKIRETGNKVFNSKNFKVGTWTYRHIPIPFDYTIVSIDNNGDSILPQIFIANPITINISFSEIKNEFIVKQELNECPLRHNLKESYTIDKINDLINDLIIIIAYYTE